MGEAVLRDLISACRSLAQARAFTLVCVLSLGIGMVPVIVVPYVPRIAAMPPPGLDASRLVEVVGGARRAGPDPESWSYPDFVRLRDAQTGLAIIGWARAPVTWQTPGAR